MKFPIFYTRLRRNPGAAVLRYKGLMGTILGDPGATSRDYAIFWGESLLLELKSPWELILTEPVPEGVEFRPADWAEKYFFCPNSDEV